MKRVANPADYVETLDASGAKRWRYVGPLFTIAWPFGRMKTLAALWATVCCATAAFVTLGILPVVGLDKRIAVIIPYVLSLWPLAMLLGDSYKITRCRLPASRRDIEAGAGRMRGDAAFAEALAVAVIIGQTGTVVGQFALGGGAAPMEIVCLAIAAAYCLIFDTARRLARRIAIHETERPEANSANAL